MTANSYKIADIIFRIEIPGDFNSLFSVLEKFKTPERELFTLKIECLECTDEFDCILRQIKFVDRLVKNGKQSLKIYTSKSWCSVLDEDEYKITLFFTPGMGKKSLSSTLGLFFCSKTSKESYLFFHAASFSIYDNSYLFPAKSGKGKTSLCRKIGDFGKIYSDEYSCVEISMGKHFILGTPFGQVNDGAIKGELKKIFFLEKGEENKFTRISPVEAMKRAWSDSFYRSQAANFDERKIVFANMFEIFKKVPSFEMKIRKDFTDFDLLKRL